MPGAKHWCFTWNNPPDDHEEVIRGLFNDASKQLKYVCYGRETGESGTPHLQGFVTFHSRVSAQHNPPSQRLFQAHWTVARRVLDAVDYCKKDGDFVELGTAPANQRGAQGERTDLAEFMEACEDADDDEPMTLKRARKEFPEVVAKYHKFATDYINDTRGSQPVEEYPLRRWQHRLNDDLKQDVDARKIIFVVDYTGNSGKSWFAHWYEQNNKRVQVMNPGRLIDMAYAIDETTTTLFIDCPRSRIELFQYDFIEYVKNGFIFSTKYESRVKRLSKCHVVVLMNEKPDMTKLSRDRYEIREVRRADLEVVLPPPPEEGGGDGDQGGVGDRETQEDDTETRNEETDAGQDDQPPMQQEGAAWAPGFIPGPLADAS